MATKSSKRVAVEIIRFGRFRIGRLKTGRYYIDRGRRSDLTFDDLNDLWLACKNAAQKEIERRKKER